MNWDEMAVVGRIARAHGIRGQVIVNPDSDFPEERFREGAELFWRRQDGTVQTLTVTSCRLQKGRPVIGVEGVADMNAAIALAGIELRVPVDWLMPLPAGTFYQHDLVGCQVSTVDGRTIGDVVEVEGDLGENRLVVRGEQGDVLVPLVDAICTTVDPAARRIVIAPPEGLLDLNVTAKGERRSRRHDRQGG